MRHVMNFHPEWGCLAPAPSFLRTMRTVLVATAVGAIAGGGVVLSWLGTRQAKRRLRSAHWCGLFPLCQLWSARLNCPLIHSRSTSRESTEISLDEGQVDGPATNELNANSPARLAVVAASAEVALTMALLLKLLLRHRPAAQKRSNMSRKKHDIRTL